MTLHEMVEEVLLFAREAAELVVLHDAAVVGLVGAGEKVTLEIAALCLEPAAKGAIKRQGVDHASSEHIGRSPQF